MKINPQTKISAIIKHDEAAIEAIASVNEHFTKLRNPILRRVLAPRVTVRDAARIGNCEVNELLQKLAAIGFEVEMGNEAAEIPPAPVDNAVIEAALQAGKARSLDVRPILAGGTDPFQHIMKALEEVPQGHVLEVINTFEPTPLIKILQKKGYTTTVKSEGESVHTFFLKSSAPAAEGDAPQGRIFHVSPEVLENERSEFSGNILEVDVRGLEMPLPMVTILGELERLPKDHALYVHHKKIPQYLLPELEERQFTTWVAELGEGDVKLLIHR